MMEMGALALGSGAVVGGVFGMNLVSGLEEHPQGNPSFFAQYKDILQMYSFFLSI